MIISKNARSLVVSPVGLSPIVRISQNLEFLEKTMNLFFTLFSILAVETLGAVCDEALNSACDKMTLQCFANKFILDIQLGALFRIGLSVILVEIRFIV